MIYMLDTNICIYIIKQKTEQVFRKFKSLDQDVDVGISSIVLMELQYGVEKSSDEYRNKNQNALERFLLPLTLYDFPCVAAKNGAKIRVDLQKFGQSIGPYDALIASHALALQAILVTNNQGEFSRVKGLQIENWL